MNDSAPSPRSAVTDASSAPWGRGLVLFSNGAEPAFRRRRLIAVVFMAAVASTQVWPIYPWLAGIDMPILGLPFSLVWVVVGLLAVLLCLAWLFRSEGPEIDPAPDGKG